MSFNIRYGTAADGPNRWDLRKELVTGRILAFDPDIAGIQEALAFQIDHLRAALPAYGSAGKGREDGAREGEFAAVFFRRSRFEELGQGHFWLSATPEVPGSIGWDASLPRMVTWVRLADRQTGRELFAFNTHFDHHGEIARKESARLLRARIDRLGAGVAVVVTGDFNTIAGEPAHDALTSTSGVVPLRDTFGDAHGRLGADESTANGFGMWGDGSRIDWILRSDALLTVFAGIDRTRPDGRYPSDHYPVTAIVR